MVDEIELHEIKTRSGKSYFFRQMTLTEQNVFTKKALMKIRPLVIGIDPAKEGLIFSGILKTELQFVILVNTLVKGDNIPDGVQINESTIDSYINVKDVEQLNSFIEELNYAKESVKKNLENSSGKKEQPEIPK